MEEVKKRRRKSAVSETVEEIPAAAADAEDSEMKNMTIEETFAALDALIDQLESGKGSLEDAFRQYEEGMKLVKSCNEKIEKIEKQIIVLSGQELGEEPMRENSNEWYI